ncbi:polysaccharide pyruvyl transferase family protein [Amedibacillus sp. YH-ame6]
MKISVITLHTVNNYGSVLQTYATQTILESMGYTVEFVDYWRKDNTGEHAIEKALESSLMQKYKKIWGINSITRKMVRLPLKFMLKKKRAPMKKFLQKRIHLTQKSYYSFEEILNDVPQADIYLTGSDQVWNSTWNKGIEKPYFLEYAPKDKKRIAFAASIGKSMLDDWEVEITKEMLKKYSSIGMREKSGVDILRGLEIHAEQVLDPTLMLTASQWKKIAEPYEQNRSYLLIYQLNKNDQMDEYAVSLAYENGWDIVRISYGYSGKQKAGKCLVCPSVETLLGCFFDAACVLTDSFHATAFSLNLNKSFVSVLPERFGTRIESILALTGTQNRLLKDYLDFSIINRPIDYNYVNNQLEIEREKSFKFLEAALNE